jgi:hypothetical protein
MLRRACREAARRTRWLSTSAAKDAPPATPYKPPRKDDGARQAEAMTPEQIEELSVFNAAGGLTAAIAGGLVVFVIGAGATLSVASGAASLLGASSSRAPPAPFRVLNPIDRSFDGSIASDY